MNIRTEAQANALLANLDAHMNAALKQSDLDRIERHNQRAVALRWLLLVAVLGWGALGWLVWALVRH